MKNYVEIIKNGIFYQAFNDDSLIVNYLFGYKIINNKCGFPLKNIDYVVSQLKKNHINFRYDDIFVKYRDNKYHQFISKAKESQNIKSRIDKITSCIYENECLLDKIEELCKIN